MEKLLIFILLFNFSIVNIDKEAVKHGEVYRLLDQMSLIVDKPQNLEEELSRLSSFFGDVEIIRESLPICSNSSFKSYMSYKAITSPTSVQYALQVIAYTDIETGHRMIDNRVMVAMGTPYAPAGRKLTLVFDGGQELKVVVGDVKHEGCTSSRDGSMLEFIVDVNRMDQNIRRLGNYNYVYYGKIINIFEDVE